MEACTANKGVAGGAVLHNSRIVVSQLDANTNMLVALTDPYRVKVIKNKINKWCTNYFSGFWRDYNSPVSFAGRRAIVKNIRQEFIAYKTKVK